MCSRFKDIRFGRVHLSLSLLWFWVWMGWEGTVRVRHWLSARHCESVLLWEHHGVFEQEEKGGKIIWHVVWMASTEAWMETRICCLNWAWSRRDGATRPDAEMASAQSPMLVHLNSACASAKIQCVLLKPSFHPPSIHPPWNPPSTRDDEIMAPSRCPNPLSLRSRWCTPDSQEAASLEKLRRSWSEATLLDDCIGLGKILLYCALNHGTITVPGVAWDNQTNTSAPRLSLFSDELMDVLVGSLRASA